MSSDSITLVNGELIDSISVFDRGLAYGDGLFETILSIDARIPFWQYHVERLELSLQRLFFPSVDTVSVLKDICQYLKPDSEQIIKIIITRGEGQPGYSAKNLKQPNIIIFIKTRSSDSKNHLSSPATVKFCNTRMAYQPQLASMKHLNRLEQVLARKEVDELNTDEGLMLGMQGEVIEATQHNVFLVKKNELFTPELTQCGVAGIMRDRVIKVARSINIPVHIQQLGKDSFLAADELFLTNSINGLWPICELEDKTFCSNKVTYQLKEIIDGIMGL